MTDLSFWGESEHGVDDKGRIIIPRDYREGLGSSVVLTRGPDHVVLLFRADVWQTIEDKLYGEALLTPSRIMQRLFSSRFQIGLDSRARMAIPQVLREWAGIEANGRVVMLGQGKSIELWSKKYWDEYQNSFTSANTLEAASELGLGDLFRL